MTRRRFRVRRRATAFKFRLSEPARGRIVIRRGLDTGANTISFSGRLGGRKLRPGRYVAVLVVTDRAGNRSLPVLVEFTVLHPR